MKKPDVTALSEQLHIRFGCRITCRGGRLADDGHPSHTEAWADTAEAIIAALAAQGWRITSAPGYATGGNDDAPSTRTQGWRMYRNPTVSEMRADPADPNEGMDDLDAVKATLRATIAGLNERSARERRLRFALDFHNKTPSGKVRECLPGCIACAALAETPEVPDGEA